MLGQQAEGDKGQFQCATGFWERSWLPSLFFRWRFCLEDGHFQRRRLASRSKVALLAALGHVAESKPFAFRHVSQVGQARACSEHKRNSLPSLRNRSVLPVHFPISVCVCFSVSVPFVVLMFPFLICSLTIPRSASMSASCFFTCSSS